MSAMFLATMFSHHSIHPSPRDASISYMSIYLHIHIEIYIYVLHAYLLHALISWARVFLDSLSLKSVGRSRGVTCLVCFCWEGAACSIEQRFANFHGVPQRM